MKKLIKNCVVISCVLFAVSCGRTEETGKVLTQQDIDNCNYLDNYKWLKETFEKNDAGFEWVIQEKGMDSYKKHCEEIEERLKEAKNITECLQIFNDWGHFFRKGHFEVGLNPIQKTEQSKEQKQPKTETVNYSLETIKQQKQKFNDPFVGVWLSEPYKVGVVLDTINKNRKYVGFILETDAKEWKKGDVKFEIFEEDNKLSSNFYMRDHSMQKRNVGLKSDIEFWLGNMKFLNFEKVTGLEKKLLSASNPLFINLSKQTSLLRFPSFYGQEDTINSLIEANHKNIIAHKNLIIDLRSNDGGSDAAWREIIPFIYTNPIKTIGVEFFSTPLNRKLFLQNTSFIGRLLQRDYIKRIEKNNGKFVVRDSVYTEELDEVLPNPKNVIVLVDNGCVSSGEQFLLSAKQSKKVKIYGEPTFGALDVSNILFTTSPDGCFNLSYCCTRTLRPKSERIDGIGVKPDVIINDSIPKYKWIEFVQKEIEKQ